jgi:hypothetical protein
VVDLGPNKKRIAQLMRMLGSSGGERRNAFAALERIMQSEGITWSDIGNTVEHPANGGEVDSEGKYTEAEMLELSLFARKEGVEEGIKIGKARAPQSNGHFVLPEASEMAEYCHQRPNELKDDAQREFINEMYVKTRRGINLKRGTLGYLASIYIKHGGKMK